MQLDINTEKLCKSIVAWMKKQLARASFEGFVVGISGGKDSSTTAALCVLAAGSDKVIGVLMPNGIQSDLDDSLEVCRLLGIRYRIINVGSPYSAILDSLGGARNHTKNNILPRLRMTVLYAIAQDSGYMVCGTSNASERYIGYCTKWGDAACDINPLGSLTTDEVIAMGKYLGIPERVLGKAPNDGVCGKPDEESIGFSYAALNEYIKTGNCENDFIRKKIVNRHKSTAHKFKTIPIFKF